MAEHCTDPLRYFTQKLFCPLCRDFFKSPKQLPCLDSACLPCLEALQKTSGHVITCPCCEQKGEMTVDLPNSPYIASLSQVAQIMSRKLSLLQCVSCKKEPTTVRGIYCVQCVEFWCENCVTQQNDNHVDHGLVHVKDIQDAQSPLKPRTNCQEENHEGKEVELFCTECETAICQLCSQTEHAGHQKKVIKTIADTRKR